MIPSKVIEKNIRSSIDSANREVLEMSNFQRLSSRRKRCIELDQRLDSAV